MKKLDPKTQANINDKIKDNKKLTKQTLKPDSEGKNGTHLIKKDATLPKGANFWPHDHRSSQTR